MMKLFSAVTDFVGFSMILIDFTMKKRAGNLKMMMSYLFSMTEVAVESGSRSGSDEIHASFYYTGTHFESMLKKDQRLVR